MATKLKCHPLAVGVSHFPEAGQIMKYCMQHTSGVPGLALTLQQTKQPCSHFTASNSHGTLRASGAPLMLASGVTADLFEASQLTVICSG